MTKRIEQEKIDGILSKYITKKYTLVQLAKEYCISPTSVKNILRRNDIEVDTTIKENFFRIYTINHKYFDILDERNAYWLGLLYSDGCVFENTIRLGLQKEDEEILEKLSKDINSNKPLFFDKRKTEENNLKDVMVFIVSSPILVDRLKQLGCTSRKTFTLKFPTEDQVPKHLLRHWLRGMWDGDGCCSMTISKKKEGVSLTSSLVSTMNVCIGVKSFLNENLDISSSIMQPKKDKNTAILSIRGCKSSCKFFKWLYADCDRYFERKYNKVNGFIDFLTERIKTSHTLRWIMRGVLC